MPHALVLGLFEDRAAAAAAARALHAAGVDRDHLSVVARTRDEEGALAAALDGSPGSDIEDSRAAARLGELGAFVLAAVASVMPGIGPIVSAGPLSADLGEVAGHAAGGLAAVLARAGVGPGRAAELEAAVGRGAVLLGVHAPPDRVDVVTKLLVSAGAGALERASWDD